MSQSLEYLTEEIFVQALNLAAITLPEYDEQTDEPTGENVPIETLHRGDAALIEKFGGIIVAAEQGDPRSINYRDRKKTVYDLTVDVDLRGLIPLTNALDQDSLWGAIDDVVQGIPDAALPDELIQQFGAFHLWQSRTSDAQRNDDKRIYARRYVVSASLA